MPTLTDRKAVLEGQVAMAQSSLVQIQAQIDQLNQSAEPYRAQVADLAKQIAVFDELLNDPDVTPAPATEAPVEQAVDPNTGQPV